MKRRQRGRARIRERRIISARHVVRSSLTNTPSATRARAQPSAERDSASSMSQGVGHKPWLAHEWPQAVLRSSPREGPQDGALLNTRTAQPFLCSRSLERNTLGTFSASPTAASPSLPGTCAEPLAYTGRGYYIYPSRV